MNLKYINLNKLNLIKCNYYYNKILFIRIIKINTNIYIQINNYYNFNYYKIKYNYCIKKILIKFKFEKFLLITLHIKFQSSKNFYIQDNIYLRHLNLIKQIYKYLNYINNIKTKKNLHKQLYNNYLFSVNNKNINFQIIPLIRELYVQIYYIYNTKLYFKYNILKYTTLQLKLFNIKKTLFRIEKIFESLNTSQYYIISNNISIIFKYTINNNYLNLIILKISYINLILINIQKTLIIYNNKLTLPKIENIKITYGGELITYNTFIPKEIISKFYNNIKLTTTNYESSKSTLHFGYNLILESLINEYKFQGILLPIKFFELISKKMNLCIKINFIGDTYFATEDVIPLIYVNIINYNYYKYGYNQANYYPIILGITRLTLGLNGLLATLSFQETLKTLSKLILELQFDWLLDFKSKIISSELLESGTGWFKHFIYKK